MIRAPGIEDGIITFSMLNSIALAITTGIQIDRGLGERGATLSPNDATVLLKAVWVSISVYCASIGLTKIAILLQYQRVFATRKFQIWCWTFIAIVVAYTIATVVACIFVCVPVQAFWWPSREGATCIDETASWFANAAINIVTDFMIIILPVPVIKRLNLAKRQKQALIAIFASFPANSYSTGVCIISILRLHSLFLITHTTDPTYDNVGVATWSVVEINVSIICSCLPCLRPLVARWVPGVSSSHSRPSGGSNGYQSHQQKGLSALPMPLNNLKSSFTNSGKGGKRDDYEEEDKIQVFTVVDVQVEESKRRKGESDVRRDTSTEELVRDAHVHHIV
ncbi:hypothetical protein K469DRAFT_653382 [Zopfia rhizophila CBS 207.26]|uniref:Rhodopsin domain-containing protein n=1 Tax=Zopfia rhizophila CBS 207.26 TaxID=1314779 RepID=A0A6A6EQD6_9PEZI|nr:hypothetical protein K469DRAFT_653382 [Zopfia rhizophila CBS 207.26]